MDVYPSAAAILPVYGAWRSLVSVRALGARGRRFESGRPDRWVYGLSRVRAAVIRTWSVVPCLAGAEAANPNSHDVDGETRLERRLDRAVDRATTPRGAAIVIASVSAVITVASGILATVVEHETYPSIGSGLWWAAQTVTTVGYGDNVPTTVAGRLMAVLVMFVGIGFLTVVTAAITSTFVAHARRVDQTSSPDEASVADQLRQIDGRLERIEAALDPSSSS